MTRYMGIMMELKGMSIENTKSPKMNLDRRVFVLHSFQPAREEKSMMSVTLTPESRTVLPRLRK